MLASKLLSSLLKMTNSFLVMFLILVFVVVVVLSSGPLASGLK